jgi:4-amino-4-deoxy-L-arabinose transferase-like glycosyltransferase
LNRADSIAWVSAALLAVWCVGLFGRGYWTPDEPREADIAWRMSWQPDKAVPLLAGEAFCEKPPLTYWLAAGPIAWFGTAAWAARLPNLLYAILGALSVAALARRAAGPIAALAAGAALGSFLLAYQVVIWLATDAPLLAAVAVALLGQYVGFYAQVRRERLLGYCTMHVALGVGFLCKSAAAWVVPAASFLVLVVWERRFREFARWELYVGGIAQAALILPWIGFVWAGPQGDSNLKVFFWNNLVGRVTRIDAPAELQYAAAHRNTPGKYLLELPLYLWPWTLLVFAAAYRAFRERGRPSAERRAVRFALAVALPSLVLLSFAATARNVYLAPALPGAALLLGWWVEGLVARQTPVDAAALRATTVLIAAAIVAFATAVVLLASLNPSAQGLSPRFALTSAFGLVLAVLCAGFSWRALGRSRPLAALFTLLLGYCALLVFPASQIYARVDAWQNLGALGRALRADVGTRPLILFAPDETTRAWVDMFTRSDAIRVAGPGDAAGLDALRSAAALRPGAWVLVQLPGREIAPDVERLARRWNLEHRLEHRLDDRLDDRADGPGGTAAAPGWAADLGMRLVKRYSLPNGRRYAVLESAAD